MACIHVSPTYQVTYGDGHFKNMQSEINRLIDEHCDNVHFDYEDVDSCDRIEVPRTELVLLIAKIAEDKEDFGKWLNLYSFDCTADEFINIISGWIAESDPRNEYVVLTWF